MIDSLGSGVDLQIVPFIVKSGTIDTARMTIDSKIDGAPHPNIAFVMLFIRKVGAIHEYQYCPSSRGIRCIAESSLDCVKLHDIIL